MTKLTTQQRRAATLEALSPGANISEISRKYGIHRNSLYGFVDKAMRNPKQRWRDAESEAAFRRKVWEMVR